MRWLMSALAVASLGLASCASHQTALDLQRPSLPNAMIFSVPPGHQFYHTVSLDYISGMSQHSFWFSEVNQKAYRPQINKALEDSGMLAPTALAARYGLQIEFVDLKGSVFGTDFESRSRAIYRLVDRKTDRVLFSAPVDAGFSARFVGLNEDDAISPLNALGLLFPETYIGSPNVFGADAEVRAHAHNGDLSTSGYASRSGFIRGKQADFQMTKQSIAKFILAFSTNQHLPMTVLLPCLDNDDIDQEKAALTARGVRWVEDDCSLYPERSPLIN